MTITRCVLRWGLIGGLGLGAATLILGPHRVANGLSHMRVKAQDVVDGVCDNENPEAMRRQLKALADQYPDRIAEVQGELAEVSHQLGQFERDVQIATHVVSMSTEDLTELKVLVARAEQAQETGIRKASIRFDGIRFDIDEAYQEARRINNVRVQYQDRMAHDQQQMAFLGEQQSRLADILGQLEEDYATYQTQLWALEREIDAIERNDRLIELTEKQQATLAEFDRYGEVTNLKQIEGKLAELKAIQKAQLETLNKRGMRFDYERAAERNVDFGDTVMPTNSNDDDPFADIIIDGEMNTEATSGEDFAWLGADETVIERH